MEPFHPISSPHIPNDLIKSFNLENMAPLTKISQQANNLSYEYLRRDMEKIELSLHAKFNKLKAELLTEQLKNLKTFPPIIIQNKTEISTSSYSEVNAQSKEKAKNSYFDIIKNFFDSRVNRVFVLIGFGLIFYMVKEKWRHTWRMTLLKNKLDSNVVFKVSNLLKEVFRINI